MRNGTVVYYKLSAQDVATINTRRDVYDQGDAPHGVQLHTGTPVTEGQEFGMIVTDSDPDGTGISGQVILNGEDTLWVQMVEEGTEPGTYAVA